MAAQLAPSQEELSSELVTCKLCKIYIYEYHRSEEIEAEKLLKVLEVSLLDVSNITRKINKYNNVLSHNKDN